MKKLSIIFGLVTLTGCSKNPTDTKNHCKCVTIQVHCIRDKNKTAPNKVVSIDTTISYPVSQYNCTGISQAPRWIAYSTAIGDANDSMTVICSDF
jgi:hypothetical protein